MCPELRVLTRVCFSSSSQCWLRLSHPAMVLYELVSESCLACDKHACILQNVWVANEDFGHTSVSKAIATCHWHSWAIQRAFAMPCSWTSLAGVLADTRSHMSVPGTTRHVKWELWRRQQDKRPGSVFNNHRYSTCPYNFSAHQSITHIIRPGYQYLWLCGIHHLISAPQPYWMGLL